MGREAEALTCYQNVLRLDRDYSMARLHMGLILVSQGKDDEARWHLQKFAETAEPSVVRDFVIMAFQGASMGLPLDQLLMPLSDANCSQAHHVRGA